MESSIQNCADARHLVHLAVGDDTNAEEERRLSDHLHGCSVCRSYHADMVDAMQIVELARDGEATEVPSGAVWGAIAHRIQSQTRPATKRTSQRRFNGSIAALCACSLTLALVTVVRNLPTADDSLTADMNVPTATAVSYDRSGAAATAPARLVPVQLKNGDRVLMDPASGRMFVPNLLHAVDAKQDVTF